jgi:hypothetical protein
MEGYSLAFLISPGTLGPLDFPQAGLSVQPNATLAFFILETSMDPNSRPGTAALLRRYCVDVEGKAINFIESFLEPGRFLAQALDYKGFPLEGRVLTVREIQAMKLFTNLREARAYAGRQARQLAFVEAGKASDGR